MAQDIRSLSDGEIIDRMGRLGVQIKTLEQEKSDLCQELLRRGLVAGDGNFFHASKIESYVQTSFDRKRLEAEKGEAFVAPYLKFVTVKATIKVTPRADAAAKLMAAE